MSKKMKISILVTVVLLMVVGFSYLFPSENKDKKPKISESEKSLYKKFLNQDGLHILEELLKNYPQIDSLKVIRDNIDTNLNTEFNNNKPSVYLLMDKDINLTNNSIDTLMQFVENGNVALVAVSQFSSYFSQKLAYSSLTSYVSDDEISLSFEHPDFKMYLPYLFQTIKYERAKYRSWNYFNLENMFTDSDRIVCIGKETYYDNPVFIKVPYGNGDF